MPYFQILLHPTQIQALSICSQLLSVGTTAVCPLKIWDWDNVHAIWKEEGRTHELAGRRVLDATTFYYRMTYVGSMVNGLTYLSTFLSMCSPPLRKNLMATNSFVLLDDFVTNYDCRKPKHLLNEVKQAALFALYTTSRMAISCMYSQHNKCPAKKEVLISWKSSSLSTPWMTAM